MHVLLTLFVSCINPERLSAGNRYHRVIADALDN